jgi:hypothetical protein
MDQSPALSIRRGCGWTPFRRELSAFAVGQQARWPANRFTVNPAKAGIQPIAGW